jgi:hypothetical protein
MRAILMAAISVTTAAIITVGSTAPGAAADLALVRAHHRHYVAAVDCPPVPGGVYFGRIDRWRSRAGECHLDDWQDRPGIDVVWNNWNLW